MISLTSVSTTTVPTPTGWGTLPVNFEGGTDCATSFLALFSVTAGEGAPSEGNQAQLSAPAGPLVLATTATEGDAGRLAVLDLPTIPADNDNGNGNRMPAGGKTGKVLPSASRFLGQGSPTGSSPIMTELGEPAHGMSDDLAEKPAAKSSTVLLPVMSPVAPPAALPVSLTAPEADLRASPEPRAMADAGTPAKGREFERPAATEADGKALPPSAGGRVGQVQVRAPRLDAHTVPAAAEAIDQNGDGKTSPARRGSAELVAGYAELVSRPGPAAPADRPVRAARSFARVVPSIPAEALPVDGKDALAPRPDNLSGEASAARSRPPVEGGPRETDARKADPALIRLLDSAVRVRGQQDMRDDVTAADLPQIGVQVVSQPDPGSPGRNAQETIGFAAPRDVSISPVHSNPMQALDRVVEQLAMSRDAALTARASLAVDHADFGPIEMIFDREPKGTLSVQFVSQNPEAHRAIQAAMGSQQSLGADSSQAGSAHSQGSSQGRTGGALGEQNHGSQRENAGERQRQPGSEQRHPAATARREEAKSSPSGTFA